MCFLKYLRDVIYDGGGGESAVWGGRGVGGVSQSAICFESLFIDEPALSLSSLSAALRAFLFSLSVLVGV